MIVPVAFALLVQAAQPSDALLCTRVVDQHQREAIAEARADTVGTFPRSSFLRGCLALGADKPDDAINAFERASAAASGNPVFQLWLGRAYGAQAQRAFVLRQALLARRAREAFERAIAIDPAYLPAREARMQFALQAPSFLGGGVDRARAEAAEIRRRDAHWGDVARVTIARHERDSASVRALLTKIVTDFPDSGKYVFALATDLAGSREYAGAWRVLDAFAERQPDDLRLQYAIGSLSAQSRQHLERGERALRRYLSTEWTYGTPAYAAAHLKLGHVLEADGQREKALSEYDEAHRLDRNLTEAQRAAERLRK